MQNRITDGKDMHGKPRHVFTVRLHRIPGRTVVAFFPFGFRTRGKAKFAVSALTVTLLANCSFCRIAV
eukprot:scaffold79412_cov66-Phaeocystis_antarctica.AAC.5